jgi:hypothetical protein
LASESLPECSFWRWWSGSTPRHPTGFKSSNLYLDAAGDRHCGKSKSGKKCDNESVTAGMMARRTAATTKVIKHHLSHARRRQNLAAGVRV